MGKTWFHNLCFVKRWGT